MEFTASDIAQLLNGRIDGNPNEKVSQLSKIEEGMPGSVSFLSNPKYLSFIYSTNASIVIVDEGFVPEKEVASTLIFVPNAQRAFAELLKYYNKVRYSKTGIESPSYLSESAHFGKDVYLGAFTYVGENVHIADNAKIYPNCYIGDNVKVGESTILMPGTRIYSDCIIGKNCFIHANTVIGSDGFGFTPTGENGKLEKVPQIGNVIIEDEVEIGAACTIDRATLGSTIIRTGAKLDNQIQIAHNVEIGSYTVIASQAGIAGSTKVGQGAQIGGQVGISGHLQIGNKVRVQAQSGLNKNAPDNTDWYGSPGMDYGDFTRSYVLFRRFPKIVKRLEELEKAFKQKKKSNNVG